MSRTTSGKPVDKDLKTVLDVLRAKYKKDHPNAQIDARRRNNVSIRVRIIDPEFAELDRVERDNKAWSYIEHLPEDVLSQITMLILITPQEEKTSLLNLEFEDPSPPLF